MPSHGVGKVARQRIRRAEQRVQKAAPAISPAAAAAIASATADFALAPAANQRVDEQLRALLMRVRQCDRSIAAAFSHAGHALLESLKQLSPSPPLPLSAPRAAGVPSPPLSAPQAAGVTAMPDVLAVITPLDDTAAPELDVAPAPDAAPALHATPTAVDTLRPWQRRNA